MGDGEPGSSGLERMRNLGPASAARLQAVGIESPEGLRMVGSMEAYARLRRAFPDETTEVSLYALHGALVDSAWEDLPEATRIALRDAAAHLVGPTNA